MSTLLLRLTGTALAVLGLVAVAVGGWFLLALGTSGSASFTAEPGERVVVLDPDVLNRVDSPVEVSAEGEGALWAGLARPSDVDAVLGDGARADVEGVEIGDWALRTSTLGEGAPLDVDALDVWGTTTTGDDTVTMTIEQEEAPQTLVVSAPEGAEIEEVELAVTDGRWGTTAAALVVGGLLALLLGAALLVRSRPRRPSRRYTPRRAASRHGAPRRRVGRDSREVDA